MYGRNINQYGETGIDESLDLAWFYCVTDRLVLWMTHFKRI